MMPVRSKRRHTTEATNSGPLSHRINFETLRTPNNSVRFAAVIERPTCSPMHLRVNSPTIDKTFTARPSSVRSKMKPKAQT